MDLRISTHRFRLAAAATISVLMAGCGDGDMNAGVTPGSEESTPPSTLALTGAAAPAPPPAPGSSAGIMLLPDGSPIPQQSPPATHIVESHDPAMPGRSASDPAMSGGSPSDAAPAGGLESVAQMLRFDEKTGQVFVLGMGWQSKDAFLAMYRDRPHELPPDIDGYKLHQIVKTLESAAPVQAAAVVASDSASAVAITPTRRGVN